MYFKMSLQDVIISTYTYVAHMFVSAPRYVKFGITIDEKMI